VLDPGVLRPGPVCELQGSLAVAEHGGVAVQPWRDLYLADQAAGLEVVPAAQDIPDGRFDQAIVHLQKSRAATFDDLAEAWRILGPGGELLLAGPNTLGVVSAVKRLAEDLGTAGVVVANRAKARVVRFRRDEARGAPEREATEPIEVALGTETLALETRPGVFSAKRLDAGSALLLEVLADVLRAKAPKRIVDLGCGTGVLGLASARLAPSAEILLVDADARAVACAEANLARTGAAARGRALWWDAHEKPPESGFDLALVNPPFHHRGPEVDLAPALALFESLAGWLSRHGRALVVANRTLPYEAALGRLGAVSQLADAKGYKVLSLERSSRSAAASGRNRPGSRSGGSSRSPIRSR